MHLGTPPFGFFKLFFFLIKTVGKPIKNFVHGCKDLESLLYPPGLLERNGRDKKKLAEAAKVSEDAAKKWLVKQVLWSIHLPAPRYAPRSKFYVSSPNAVHQADLLFLPHDKLPRGRKVYKYALTVVNVASRYKEAEPFTSKDSTEVAKAHGCLYQSNGKSQNLY